MTATASSKCSNLIGNAIKFTPNNGTVSVSATADGEQVHLAVRDTGLGVEPEQRPHLFNRYWQAKRSSARGSLGLGLSIARGIVEAHGGKIWVEGADGGGAVFHFTIPTHA